MYGTPSSRIEGTPRSGVRGTPARQRPDLGSVRKAPQVDLHSEPVSNLVFVMYWAHMKPEPSEVNYSLSSLSQAQMAPWPASRMPGRGWWSGGLMWMSAPARKSFRYEAESARSHNKCPVGSPWVNIGMLCVSLLPEVSPEVCWPDLHWRWERWSGPERAVIHAEAGGGAIFIVCCSKRF